MANRRIDLLYIPTSEIITNDITKAHIHTKFYPFVKQIYISWIHKQNQKTNWNQRISEGKAKGKAEKTKNKAKKANQMNKPKRLTRAKNSKKQGFKLNDLKKNSKMQEKPKTLSCRFLKGIRSQIPNM